MIDLKEVIKTENFSVYNIEEDGKIKGSVELIEKPDEISIEMIKRDTEYKGQGILNKVISYLRKNYPEKNILALPLNPYYEEIFENAGFKKKLNTEVLCFTADECNEQHQEDIAEEALTEAEIEKAKDLKHSEAWKKDNTEFKFIDLYRYFKLINSLKKYTEDEKIDLADVSNIAEDLKDFHDVDITANEGTEEIISEFKKNEIKVNSIKEAVELLKTKANDKDFMISFPNGVFVITKIAPDLIHVVDIFLGEITDKNGWYSVVADELNDLEIGYFNFTATLKGSEWKVKESDEDGRVHIFYKGGNLTEAHNAWLEYINKSNESDEFISKRVAENIQIKNTIQVILQKEGIKFKKENAWSDDFWIDSEFGKVFFQPTYSHIGLFNPDETIEVSHWGENLKYFDCTKYYDEKPYEEGVNSPDFNELKEKIQDAEFLKDIDMHQVENFLTLYTFYKNILEKYYIDIDDIRKTINQANESTLTYKYDEEGNRKPVYCFEEIDPVHKPHIKALVAAGNSKWFIITQLMKFGYTKELAEAAVDEVSKELEANEATSNIAYSLYNLAKDESAFPNERWNAIQKLKNLSDIPFDKKEIIELEEKIKIANLKGLDLISLPNKDAHALKGDKLFDFICEYFINENIDISKIEEALSKAGYSALYIEQLIDEIRQKCDPEYDLYANESIQESEIDGWKVIENGNIPYFTIYKKLDTGHTLYINLKPGKIHVVEAAFNDIINDFKTLEELNTFLYYKNITISKQLASILNKKFYTYVYGKEANEDLNIGEIHANRKFHVTLKNGDKINLMISPDYKVTVTKTTPTGLELISDAVEFKQGLKDFEKEIHNNYKNIVSKSEWSVWKPEDEKYVDLQKDVAIAQQKFESNESTMDFPKENLSDKIWDKDFNITPLANSEIAVDLENFFNSLDFDIHKMFDKIYIVGSIGTNLYRDDSDVDIHLQAVPEIEDLAHQAGYEKVEDLQKSIMDQFKNMREEKGFYIGKHPLEIYLQTNKFQDFLGDAVYSYSDGKWLKGPFFYPADYNPYEIYSETFNQLKEDLKQADINIANLGRNVKDVQYIIATYPDKASLKAILQKKFDEIKQDIENLKVDKEFLQKIRKTHNITAEDLEAMLGIANESITLDSEEEIECNESILDTKPAYTVDSLKKMKDYIQTNPIKKEGGFIKLISKEPVKIKYTNFMGQEVEGNFILKALMLTSAYNDEKVKKEFLKENVFVGNNSSSPIDGVYEILEIPENIEWQEVIL